jgi:hypothetical protein
MNITRRGLILGTILAPFLRFLPKRPRRLSWAEFEKILSDEQDRVYRETAQAWPGTFRTWTQVAPSHRGYRIPAELAEDWGLR